jgi:hypothetical protein
LIAQLGVAYFGSSDSAEKLERDVIGNELVMWQMRASATSSARAVSE